MILNIFVRLAKDDVMNNSDEFSIIENMNTPIYDRKSEVSVRCLDPKWIKESYQNKFIVQLKNNVNRVLPIPDYVRDGTQQT